MKKILVLNGPNLNLLGLREKETYGSETLIDVTKLLMKESYKQNVLLLLAQYNSEARLVGRIHAAIADGVDLIVINPASFTHTSIGLRDALLCASIPFLEVHLSNVNSREKYRNNSILSDIAIGTISGMGWKSYLWAVYYIVESIN